ncbi:site-2 protease family protein [Saccharopolyspora rhizosphaerae]|uniref:Zinc metalloprotease n=1 Tax=Saccharopolyspora rhizosphaerae TaxID=2492662 RepID=A0A426JZM6_9PSEU|nr:site-2 protease family protein [Saccharopolyspora rhizosphaerae]RRO18649.1 site-2 protease family protein [Saccharopolyspora rhizosphaerae]
MNATIPLGRIAGVRVGLHWSVLGIVVLITVGLAVHQLPQTFPGRSTAAYVTSGVAASLLLVFSLLGHELAHAAVARRNGVAVEGITLWLLGGMARLRGEASNAAAELRIAVVGPLVSALLAGVFGVLAWGAHAAGVDELVLAVITYLALINAVLAVFNLVPAAPLDGGRVLRAVLWRWSGDRFKSATWSARAGLGLGYLLIIAGIAQLIGQRAGGWWWILLGLFISSVAAAEEQRARLGTALADVRVRDVMSHPVDTVAGAVTVEKFLRTAERPHAGYPVVDGLGRVEGLATVRRMRAVPQRSRDSTTVREIATPLDDTATATPGEPLSAVLPRLSSESGGRVLVFDGRELVGILAPSDISGAVAERGGHVHRPEDAGPPPRNWWYPGQDQRR